MKKTIRVPHSMDRLLTESYKRHFGTSNSILATKLKTMLFNKRFFFRSQTKIASEQNN